MFRVLTIAGSDSGGGAGIQGDLKTFAAIGVYGASVITALTAQNTKGVLGVYEVDSNFVQLQMDAVLNDIEADSVKIGMLFDEKIIAAVVERLKFYHVGKIVVDPVMVSKSGSVLLQSSAVEALKRELLPMAKIVTPNLPEAEVLLETEVKSVSQMEKAAKDLLQFGSEAVLIKGGHLIHPTSIDCLAVRANGTVQIEWFESRRVETKNTHGTGCTLSSAIASFLAKNYGINESVKLAKEYLTEAIKAGITLSIGQGNGPVQHILEKCVYISP